MIDLALNENFIFIHSLYIYIYIVGSILVELVHSVLFFWNQNWNWTRLNDFSCF